MTPRWEPDEDVEYRPRPSPPKGPPPAHRRIPDLAEVLAFENEGLPAGRKEAEVSRRWGLRLARYYQILNRMLELPAAVEADPLLIGRLRAARDNPRRTAPLTERPQP